MARLSIWFSAGQCESFFGEEDVDDGLLLFLAEQAPLLKSLHLTDCYEVTPEAFAEAINKFPLLEELELCECYSICDKRVFELVTTSCPRLKHFKHVDWAHFWFYSACFGTGSPISYGSMGDMYCHDDDEHDFRFLFIDPYDSDDSDHSCYFSGADEIDFEEHDRILPKGMRRCLRV
uniref:Uncharacterized protein n=1 Tax=Avena sativa TaxID=4498 RepID=A0ACD6A0H0_AVESA